MIRKKLKRDRPRERRGVGRDWRKGRNNLLTNVFQQAPDRNFDVGSYKLEKRSYKVKKSGGRKERWRSLGCRKGDEREKGEV